VLDSVNAVMQGLPHVGKDNLANEKIRSVARRIVDKDMRVPREIGREI
jgi:hypothetical protein